MDELNVIVPPPDIRAIADKTADSVAKNGVEFEAKITAAYSQNPKFRFLNGDDPYRAYFDLKVKEFRERRLMGLTETEAPKVEEKPAEAAPAAAAPETAQDAAKPAVSRCSPQLCGTFVARVLVTISSCNPSSFGPHM